MTNKTWQGKAYAFFSNKDCEFFPCHTTDDINGFNCLFCYCPLYTLGSQCGGNFSYTQNGIKNCALCILPHSKDNYGLVTEKLKIVLDVLEKKG